MRQSASGRQVSANCEEGALRVLSVLGEAKGSEEGTLEATKLLVRRHIGLDVVDGEIRSR